MDLRNLISRSELAAKLRVQTQTIVKADGFAAEQQPMRHDFIHASILELEGKRQTRSPPSRNSAEA